jgi:hypothetical protein
MRRSSSYTGIQHSLSLACEVIRGAERSFVPGGGGVVSAVFFDFFKFENVALSSDTDVPASCSARRYDVGVRMYHMYDEWHSTSCLVTAVNGSTKNVIFFF